MDIYAELYFQKHFLSMPNMVHNASEYTAIPDYTYYVFLNMRF